MSRALLIAVLLALASVPGLAAGKTISEATQINLDADADLEEIVPLTVSDPTGAPEKSIVVYDRCGGTEHAFKLGSPQENVDVVVGEVDAATSRPEIRFIGSSGAAGRVGQIVLARLGSEDIKTGCPMLVSLFRYSTVDPSPRAPKGYAVAGFGVRYKDFAPRYQGKEIELTEGLASKHDALCCPSRKRISRWRYDSKKERYVRYLARVVKRR